MTARTTLDFALLRRRLAPLHKRWQRQAQRIDALSLRERAILLLSIAAVLAALFDTLVLSPLSARTRQRGEEEAQQARELTQLREQYVAVSRSSSDPASQLGRQLEAARVERARLDEALRQAASLHAGEGLSAVLQRVLGQQPGLVLERLTLLDDAPVALPTVGTAAPASAPTFAPTLAPAAIAQRPGPQAMPGLSWQGVELQVQGSYRDLQRYVQALERELPGLRWGEMRLSAPGPGDAPRLVAQLFLLKAQP